MFPMFKKINFVVLSIVIAFFQSACMTTESASNQTNARFDKVDANISNLEKSLNAQMSKNCRADRQRLVDETAVAVSEKLVDLNKAKLRTLPVPKCPTAQNKVSGDDKLLLGEVEKVYFAIAKKSINARIDTGAETSSLGVYGVQRFERDGKKWVKFGLVVGEGAMVYRYPIYDSVRIKQQNDERAEKRIEIKMTIKLGGTEYPKQIFNLADRSHLEYQALIGRNFLRDIAIVDVGSSYLLGED